MADDMTETTDIDLLNWIDSQSADIIHFTAPTMGGWTHRISWRYEGGPRRHKDGRGVRDAIKRAMSHVEPLSP